MNAYPNSPAASASDLPLTMGASAAASSSSPGVRSAAGKRSAMVDAPPAEHLAASESPARSDPFAGDGQVWATARSFRAWLDAANGTGDAELTCRVLKLTEEAGEVAGAWIGLLGQNPRKGVTHTRDEVAAELADVAFTALVAIESLGLDARTVLDRCAAKVHDRIASAERSAG